MKLLILLALSACATQAPRPVPVNLPPIVVEAPEVGASTESPSVEPVPQERTKARIKLNITPKGFKTSEARIKRIIARAEEIVNSKEFEALVTDYYNPILKQKKFYSISRPLSQSNRQVWETVTAKDLNMEYIAYCKKGTSTVGYTYPSVTWVRVNTCHSNYKSDKLVCKNIFHEFLGHKIGYGHSQKWNKLRDTSTPYKLGDFCAQLWDVKLGGANGIH